MRTTRAHLEAALRRIEQMMGFETGHFRLDSMNPGDGRTYAVETDRGERPFGHRRWRADELGEVLYAIEKACEYVGNQADARFVVSAALRRVAKAEDR